MFRCLVLFVSACAGMGASNTSLPEVSDRAQPCMDAYSAAVCRCKRGPCADGLLVMESGGGTGGCLEDGVTCGQPFMAPNCAASRSGPGIAAGDYQSAPVTSCASQGVRSRFDEECGGAAHGFMDTALFAFVNLSKTISSSTCHGLEVDSLFGMCAVEDYICPTDNQSLIAHAVAGHQGSFAKSRPMKKSGFVSQIREPTIFLIMVVVLAACSGCPTKQTLQAPSAACVGRKKMHPLARELQPAPSQTGHATGPELQQAPLRTAPAPQNAGAKPLSVGTWVAFVGPLSMMEELQINIFQPTGCVTACSAGLIQVEFAGKLAYVDPSHLVIAKADHADPIVVLSRSDCVAKTPVGSLQ